MTTSTLQKTQYSFNSVEHLHTLNGVALTGTSSVGNALAKNLTWWAAELAAVECLEAGIKIDGIREEYELAAKSKDKKQAIDALQKKYPIFKQARFAHFDSKNKAAKKGTDLHKKLEQWVRENMGIYTKGSADYPLAIIPMIVWAKDNVEQFLASEAHCYSERLWLGGVIDAVAELNDGSLAVIDFKSSKEAYPGHFLQTCLYAIQTNENGLFSSNGKHQKRLDKEITKIIVIPFGSDPIKPEIRNVADYKEGAEAAVTLYRMLGFEERTKENNKLNN